MDDKELLEFLQKKFSPSFSLKKVEGGRNNQVYKLKEKKGTYIVKKYFFHKKDPRDRLFHEKSFYSIANKLGILAVPLLIDYCSKSRAGIFSFLPGRKAIFRDVTKESLKQFVDFFWQLNESKELIKDMPLAVDNARCIRDYFSFIEKRLFKLLKIEPLKKIDKEMIFFLQKEVYPFYLRLKKDTLGSKNANFLLTKESLSLCPSDLGFHNVVIDQKKLSFFDFEYAGLDDPVNLLANFICQPETPVPSSFIPFLAEGFLENDPIALERFKLIYPLCQMKWSLLVLNLFLEVDVERRNFARANEKKERQLFLAKRILSDVAQSQL